MKSGRPFALLLVSFLSIFGVSPLAVGQTYEGNKLVNATLLADTTAFTPGKPFTVGILLRMFPGWHTYWKYPGDAGIPTEVKWKLPPGWKISEIQWPIPLKLKEPGDIQIYGYHDEVLLMQQVTPSASVNGSAVKLSAEASWLVCEKICIPGSASLQLDLPASTTGSPANSDVFARFRRLLPEAWPDSKTAAFNWRRAGNELFLQVRNPGLSQASTAVDFFPSPPGEVVLGHTQLQSRNGDEITFRIPIETSDHNLSSLNGLLVLGQQENGGNRTAWRIGSTSSEKLVGPPVPPARGLITFLFFGFVGGFILNLMPCVLPVISLKIFGFVKQAGQHRRRIFRSGLIFVAGIFAWFIGLALLLIVLKAAGHQITWALQFTNAYFVLGLSILVTVFALNLLGVFEISPPETAMRLVGSVAQEGDAGSFFHGVFATVLATPCTAPFLGTALGFAFTQSALIILSVFLAIAAGMSLPYLVLSAHPAWLRFLPKPGAWMERVKQIMGFLLLATLLFLLYVIGAQRGYEALIWAACFLLVISIACWMKGVFLLPTVSSATRNFVVGLMLLLVFGSGVYFIGGKFRSTAITESPSNIQTRVASELARGHPVFVDFTAAWCVTCKFNEKAVLDTAEVQAAFARHGITKLVADWTNGDPEITKLLQQFGRPGVPLYVLYPGQSAEPIVFPELLTKHIVLDKLETVSPSVAAQ